MTAHSDPPGLPNVIDEAADTPSWVPWLGFALVLLAGLYAALAGNPEPHDAAHGHPAAAHAEGAAPAEADAPVEADAPAHR